jgi:hypothetical protein
MKANTANKIAKKKNTGKSVYFYLNTSSSFSLLYARQLSLSHDIRVAIWLHVQSSGRTWNQSATRFREHSLDCKTHTRHHGERLRRTRLLHTTKLGNGLNDHFPDPGRGRDFLCESHKRSSSGCNEVRTEVVHTIRFMYLALF